MQGSIDYASTRRKMQEKVHPQVHPENINQCAVRTEKWRKPTATFVCSTSPNARMNLSGFDIKENAKESASPSAPESMTQCAERTEKWRKPTATFVCSTSPNARMNPSGFDIKENAI